MTINYQKEQVILHGLNYVLVIRKRHINKAIEMYEEAIKRNILCDEAKWKLKRLRRKIM